MQRSRRALLRRRALEKAIGRNRLFKLSLSLVIILWGLVFLLNLWISQGDNYRDVSGTLTLNVSSHNEDKLGSGRICVDEHSIYSSCPRHPPTQSCPKYSHESSFTVGTVAEKFSGEMLTKQQTVESDLAVEVQAKLEEPNLNTKLEIDSLMPDRLTHAIPLGLDEFKSRTINSISKSVSGPTGNVIHRVEPGGAEYNYASAAKGAKVLAFNKEAKGASNILGKDKDKYLRNPCSAEEKFVLIELSEETLVDTIEIANFEHYSSNLKDFEILGSLAYPTDSWVSVGNFTAANVKLAQRFNLPDPKWARYLKLRLLSHYGTEFYCTLSSIEVHGVDAIERMLEDLISFPDKQFPIVEPVRESDAPPPPPPMEQNDPDRDIFNGIEPQKVSEGTNMKNPNVPDTLQEVRHQQISRMPGDTVLKILMQKVRTLDLSLSVLERYLEELNSKYGNIFKQVNGEMADRAVLLENVQSNLKNLLGSVEVTAKDISELASWRSLVSIQMDGLLKDNAIVRSELTKIRENQMYMESKGIVVFLTSLVFGFLAVVMLFIDKAFSSVHRSEESGKFCWISSSWLLLLLSCSTTVFVLSL
ncbi:hypothetical protein Dimus_005963 [Dionaea muscipula]